MIDLLFLAHNRRAFTVASVEALLANTTWSKVRSVSTFDDQSTDGTHEYLANVKWPVDSKHTRGTFGGPVAIMNAFISERKPGLFAKIDNDVLLPKNWLTECLSVMEASPALDLLGFECNNDFPAPGIIWRGYEPAQHIGGIGLMRGRPFEMYGLPGADGRQGFTQWQHRHESIVKGWLKPCLPVALLDHLPMEPWKSLSEEYISRGWQRHGWNGSNFYEERSFRLWEWWSGARVEATVAR